MYCGGQAKEIGCYYFGMPPQQMGTGGSKIRWHEVTWYSKLGAIVVLLGIVPALSFYIGTQYEATVSVMFTQSVPISLNMRNTSQTVFATSTSATESAQYPALVSDQNPIVPTQRSIVSSSPITFKRATTYNEMQVTEFPFIDGNAVSYRLYADSGPDAGTYKIVNVAGVDSKNFQDVSGQLYPIIDNQKGEVSYVFDYYRDDNNVYLFQIRSDMGGEEKYMDVISGADPTSFTISSSGIPHDKFRNYSIAWKCGTDGSYCKWITVDYQY